MGAVKTIFKLQDINLSLNVCVLCNENFNRIYRIFLQIRKFNDWLRSQLQLQANLAKCFQKVNFWHSFFLA